MPLIFTKGPKLLKVTYFRAVFGTRDGTVRRLAGDADDPKPAQCLEKKFNPLLTQRPTQLGTDEADPATAFSQAASALNVGPKQRVQPPVKSWSLQSLAHEDPH